MNKVNTRVTARLPLDSLPLLDRGHVEMARSRLAGRLNADGEVVVHVQEERSQARNREIARERLLTLVLGALSEKRRRRPTRPSKAARSARLENKRKRSQAKANRRRVDPRGEY